MSQTHNKRILLHIGTGKTGSTAIQDFLRCNVEPLSRAGIVVPSATLLPGARVRGHQVGLFEELRRDIAGGQPIVAERIERLMASLTGGQTLIVSAENLSIPDGVHRLFEALPKKYEVRILVYIRRQDEFLLSSWEQWGAKRTGDFWAWMLSAVGKRGDWRQMIAPWEQIVPRKQIQVRIYDRKRLPGGDVVADLLQVLGIGQQVSDFNIERRASNPGYSEAVRAFAKANPRSTRGKQANEFYDVVDALTGDRYHSRGQPMLSYHQRVAILARYSDINEWIRKCYFQDIPAPLFSIPEEEAGVIEAAAEQRWDLPASVLYGVAKRVFS